MAGITLAPTPLELGLHREQYDRLVRELEEQGHDVELRRPIEERAPPGDASGPAPALELAVHIAGFVSDHIVDALVGVLIARLASRLRRNEPRRVTIYGPDGRVLRELELPSEAE
jgi:hypothetical protein